MRSILLILISLALSQWAWANCDTNKKKTVVHHKKVVHHQVNKRERYKLVSYYKNGKLKHKYIDTRPQGETVASAEGSSILPSVKYIDLKGDDLISRSPTSSQAKLDSKVKN